VTDPERPRLTFFFPAYNEEENVAETVQRALAEIGPMVDGSLEVLIVDDGSTDRTPEMADALAAADPRVRVHHQANRGYGGALRAGFENANGSLIAFSDGDLQFDLRELARLLERLDDNRRPVDVVIGYRLKRRDPPHRIFIAKTYNAIVSVPGHRLRHEGLPSRGLRGAPADDRFAVPVGGAAHQAPRTRRADRAGRRDALPAGSWDEHRSVVPQDPADIPGHRETAVGDVDAPA